MKEKIVGAYTISIAGSDKKYVGSSNNLLKRKSVHKSLLKNNKHYNVELQNTYNENSNKEIKFEFKETNTREEAYKLEQNILDSSNNLFNTAKNAECPATGRVFSESTKNKLRNKTITDEFREKMRVINTGKKHSDETKEKIRSFNTGLKKKPLSDEHKAKLSIARLGKKASPETIEKLRISHLGKSNGPISEEQKQKISAANKGKIRTIEQRENYRNARLAFLERKQER